MEKKSKRNTAKSYSHQKCNTDMVYKLGVLGFKLNKQLLKILIHKTLISRFVH